MLNWTLLPLSKTLNSIYEFEKCRGMIWCDVWPISGCQNACLSKMFSDYLSIIRHDPTCLKSSSKIVTEKKKGKVRARPLCYGFQIPIRKLFLCRHRRFWVSATFFLQSSPILEIKKSNSLNFRLSFLFVLQSLLALHSLELWDHWKYLLIFAISIQIEHSLPLSFQYIELESWFLL